MKKFLIIDGNSIMNRAFYGISATRMTNSSGIPTNALYGFLNIYWMIQEQFTPDFVAVSFDLRAPTFRHKMYDQYKGTRKGMPEELAEQMPIIKEILDAMNIPILELEGYEADDILGTVASKNEKEGIFTYILTGDKDSLQLISDTTSIVIPTTKMGKTEYTTYTPAMLLAKQNIEPYQVIHIKSLMGDASDNIPGVKGVGEKTAYALIDKYTTLENIYQNIDTLDVSPKMKEKLVENKETAFLSKDLATINRQVPIELNYDKCLVTDVDKAKLFRLFKKLEFNKFMSKYDFSNITITEELKENSKQQLQLETICNVKNFLIIEQENFDLYQERIHQILQEEKISYLLQIPNLHYFIPTLPLKDRKILCLYSSLEDFIYVINLGELTPENEKSILLDFATSQSIKISYQMKQDIRYLFDFITPKVNHFSFDIMIAYYLIDTIRNHYPIEHIFNDLYHLSFLEGKQQDDEVQLTMFETVENTPEEFLSQSDIKNITMYLKGLYFAYKDIYQTLESLELKELFDTIEMPLVETLASIEHVGMYIDLEKLNQFDTEISKRLQELESQIFSLAGEEFNLNSPQQLGVILFEKLNLPSKKKTKKGYSTDKSVLDELQGLHPIVDAILEYRQTNKLKTTYVDSLRDKIASDKRVHTTFMQTVTATGRLSSTEPNLQNIPVRLELGKKIRSFFVAENSNQILDADYSQIELRVLSHISGDSTMIEAFKNNIDIHKVTASQVFDVPLEDVTSQMRSKAKAVNFGIVYGISEFGLAKNIATSRKEAKLYIQNYLEKYHGIREFMKNIVEEAKEKGYVTTLYHRRRYIPEINEKNKNIALFGERVAMNTPIQGTAADIIKLAMNRIYQILKEKNYRSKLIMQVHDELLIEAVPEEIEEIKKIMHTAMEDVVQLAVPLDIDLNVGKSWFDAK